MHKEYYGQLKQDEIIHFYFKLFPERNKTFIDVGAFDGISFSNTFFFFKQGWNGICIEPAKKNFNKLHELYKGSSIHTVRAAATDFEGQLTLNVATIPWERDWGSDVSSTTDNTKKRFPEYEWNEEIVLAKTLNTIIKDSPISDFDYLSIDVEGHELEVLKGLDLTKYQPQIILVEYSSKPDKKALKSYLKQFDYFCWYDNYQDLFFVRSKRLKYLISWFMGLIWHLNKPKQVIHNIFYDLFRSEKIKPQ